MLVPKFLSVSLVRSAKGLNVESKRSVFMDVADLVRYNHTIRGSYLDALSKLSWAVVVEPRGLSFGSMRNVFVHLTLVEDGWINYVIPGRFKEWGDPDFEAFKDMDSLKKCRLRVEEKTESYLAKLSVEELNRQIPIPWSDFPKTEASIETILKHTVLEDMIHYGELSASFWQIGEEAPYIAFWQYKTREY